MPRATCDGGWMSSDAILIGNGSVGGKNRVVGLDISSRLLCIPQR